VKWLAGHRPKAKWNHYSTAEEANVEMIACGSSLTDVLEDLCDTIDDPAPEIIS